MTYPPATAWSIRRANREDADQLVPLIVGAFADVGRRFGLDRDNCATHPSFITRERIERCFDRGTEFLLTFSDDRIGGCIGIQHSDEGVTTLEKLAVHPDFRRRRLGSLLVERGAVQAREAGAIQVEVGIIAHQTELRAWYESIGFRSVRTGQFKHLPFDVLYLRYLCPTAVI